MQKLNSEQIEYMLKSYPNWQYDEEGEKIVTVFEFEDFGTAADFAYGIAEIARTNGHYPDIVLHDANYVSIFTSTNDIQGISESDFNLIKDIENQLAEDDAENEESDDDDTDDLSE